MKTLSEVFTIENLLVSHKKCRRCKQHKREVVVFELNLFENLLKIRNEILNKTYTIKHYRVFEVYEPKKRTIESLSYKHRVIQRCLCDFLLKETLEPYLIFDNAACRENKGTDFARNRLKGFIKKFFVKFGFEGYYLKCDIKKFFPSIDHNILKEKLKKIFSEEIMWLLCVFIDSINNVGLPIGNQTSQWFALVLLNDLDHFVKETLGCKYYIRYMDDIVIIHHDKEFLRNCKKIILHIVKGLNLSLNSKTKISKLSEGIDFLGFKYKIKDKKVGSWLGRLAKARLKRSSKKIYQKYLYGFYSIEKTINYLFSYKKYLVRCKNKKLYKKFHI